MYFLPPVRNWKKGACAKWGQSHCNFSGWGQFLQNFISWVAKPQLIWDMHKCFCKSFENGPHPKLRHSLKAKTIIYIAFHIKIFEKSHQITYSLKTYMWSYHDYQWLDNIFKLGSIVQGGGPQFSLNPGSLKLFPNFFEIWNLRQIFLNW